MNLAFSIQTSHFCQMSSIATGVEDLWRIKCELANISQVLSNGVERVK